MPSLYTNPSAMQPLLPDQVGPIADLAVEVYKVSATAAGMIHPLVFKELKDLLRVVNSYYSNLIEGNNTHPVEILRTLHLGPPKDPARRARAIESAAHVEVQKLIEQRLAAEPNLDITNADFIAWVHKIFYDRLPDELRVVRNTHTGEELVVIPGQLRTREVEVGQHIAPAADRLQVFLTEFSRAYGLSRLHGHDRLIAAAAAHHRLVWIHPFLDGNGRVGRLFTDAYLRRAGVMGYGLWTISRGLARSNAEYRDHLAAADEARRGDLDGRGNLSMAALRDWCKWFLEISLDQATYMAKLLALDGLRSRIEAYTRLRQEGIALGPQGTKCPLKAEARSILLYTFVVGEVARGEFVEVTGKSERTTRDAVGMLLDEGLLKSDTPKGAVRLGFPAHSLNVLFPELVPDIPRR